jgi:hypothetical protein
MREKSETWDVLADQYILMNQLLHKALKECREESRNKNMDNLKFKFKRAYYNFKYFLDFCIADLLKILVYTVLTVMIINWAVDISSTLEYVLYYILVFTSIVGIEMFIKLGKSDNYVRTLAYSTRTNLVSHVCKKSNTAIMIRATGQTFETILKIIPEIYGCTITVVNNELQIVGAGIHIAKGDLVIISDDVEVIKEASITRSVEDSYYKVTEFTSF